MLFLLFYFRSQRALLNTDKTREHNILLATYYSSNIIPEISVVYAIL